MIGRIIEFSLKNKFLILLMAVSIGAGGYYSLPQTPLDAIPDLSDVQAIVFTEYPRQAPTIVEDKVTYPPTPPPLLVPLAFPGGYKILAPLFVLAVALASPPSTQLPRHCMKPATR